MSDKGSFKKGFKVTKLKKKSAEDRRNLCANHPLPKIIDQVTVKAVNRSPPI